MLRSMLLPFIRLHQSSILLYHQYQCIPASHLGKHQPIFCLDYGLTTVYVTLGLKQQQ